MPDFYLPQADIDAVVTALKAADPGDEVILYTTFKGNATEGRRSHGHIPCLRMSIWTDQAMTLSHRHLSAQAESSSPIAVSNEWRAAPMVDAGTETQDPVSVEASDLTPVLADFFGDDHALVATIGASAPTVVELSMRVTDHP